MSDKKDTHRKRENVVADHDDKHGGDDDGDDDIHLIRASNKLKTKFYDIRKHWTVFERRWTSFATHANTLEEEEEKK